MTTENVNPSALMKAIANGKVAIVPNNWLKLLQDGDRKSRLITKSKTLEKHGPGRRERIYMVVEGRETIRKARKTESAIFDYAKGKIGGITIEQTSKDLKLPLSTVAYNLRKLTRRGAMHF
jgi:hypothetical protein